MQASAGYDGLRLVKPGADLQCSERVEALRACSQEDGPVVLRLLSRGTGIGWFPQKELRLTIDQAKRLREALGVLLAQEESRVRAQPAAGSHLRLLE